jgi:hypothetical protein
MGKLKLGSHTLDELRTLITKTVDELAVLEQAPLPLGEVNAALTVAIDGVAAEYRERIRPLLAQATRGQPLGELLSLLVPSMESEPRVVHGFLLVALHEQLVSFWHSILQELYEHTPALAERAIPRSERPARRRALEETLLELSIAEERSICEAERRGQHVDRRADVDPRALFHDSVLLEGETSHGA